MVKTLFNINFPMAAATMMRSITVDKTDPYRMAALKWSVTLLERVDSEVSRAALGTLTPAETDDPSLGRAADALRYYGGESAVEAHNEAGAQVFFSGIERGSKYWRAASVALASLHLVGRSPTDDVATLADAAKDANPNVVRDAVRRLSEVARTSSSKPAMQQARAALAQLAATNPRAAFETSRFALADKQVALAFVDPDLLAAAAAAVACRGDKVEAAKVREVAHAAVARVGGSCSTATTTPTSPSCSSATKQVLDVGPRTAADAAVFTAPGLDTPALEQAWRCCAPSSAPSSRR